MPFRFDGRDRLASTLDALERRLACGDFPYRCSGADREEGCFVACAFRIAEARMLPGQRERGERLLHRAQRRLLLQGTGVCSEMIDARGGAFLGNLPQGLSHLAHATALDVMAAQDGCGSDGDA